MPYTKAAGRILVSAAGKNGRTLVCVTIHAPNDWNDHAALLDEGFSCFELKQLAAAGQSLAEIQLLSGETLELCAAEDWHYPLLPGEKAEFVLNFAPMAWSAEELPQVEMIVKLYGKEIGRIPLAAE